MEERMNITGNWAGLFVHFPSFDFVALQLNAAGERITGTYEIVDTEQDPKPMGDLTGTIRGRDVLLRLPEDNPHGALRFEGRVHEGGGQLMMTGIVHLKDAEIPFGTLTAFKVPREDKIVKAAWSALEFGPK